MKIRLATLDDRPKLQSFLTDRWGSTVLIINGEEVDALECEALVAGDFSAVITFRIEGDSAEIVSFNAVPPLAGLGSNLLNAFIDLMRQRQINTVNVTTTNDNVNALRFYQRRGFRLSVLRPGAVDAARRLKPSIPKEGRHKIALRDELVMSLPLTDPLYA
ncbi:MAG: GNAT family N-acetyltransferase [Pseudomonadota bacterium]